MWGCSSEGERLLCTQEVRGSNPLASTRESCVGDRAQGQRKDGLQGNLNHPLIARWLPAADRRATRQTLWMGAITAVQLLGGLAQTAIAARILGPEGFGILAVIIAATLLIYGLLSMEGGEAIITFATRAVTEGRPEEAAQVWRFTLAVSFGLSLIAYALIAVLTLAGGNLLGIAPAYLDATLWYGLAGIFLATQTENLAALRLADRLGWGLAVMLVSALTRIVLLAVAWSTGGGLLAVILAYLAGAAVIGVGMFAAAAIVAPRAGLPGLLRSWSVRVPVDVARFQTGTFGKSAVWHLAFNLDYLLLAHFAGAAEVGLYRGARQIIEGARHPFRPLADGVQPEYSRHWYSRRGPELRRMSWRFFLVSALLALAGFGLLAALYQPITRLILGAEFSGSAVLLLFMIPGAFLFSAFATLTPLPVAVGRVWPSLAAAGVGLAVSISFIALLAPRYGAAGVAVSYTAYFIVLVAVLVPFALLVLRQSRHTERKP